jgi:cell division septation protein DedD
MVTGVAVESLPPVPPSRLEVPVRYDLKPALDWLETAVPKTIGDIKNKQAIKGNDRVHIAYAITREPFQVGIEGRTVTISSVLHYEGRGWYDAPIVPEVSASCGTDSLRPRAKLTLSVTGLIDQKWKLQAKSTVTAVPLTDTERDQCEVTAAHIDVTSKVLGAAAGALQNELVKVDRKLGAYPLRSTVEGVWNTMQKPLRLTDSLWLLINPVSLRFLPPTTSKDSLLWQAGLEANPRIVGGAKPPASTNPLLPPDRSPAPPPAFLILSEGRLPYDVAEDILSKALKKTKIKVGSHTIAIQHLKPAPLGDGRVSVALTVSGAANGTLYAVGHPHIDSAGVLTMPDLTIDAGSTDALTGALAWLASGDRLTQFLREAIKVNLAPTIEKARVLAEQNMNRELTPGLELHSTLTSAVPIGVWAGPDALIARVIVQGQGSITIHLYPPGAQASDSGRADSTPAPQKAAAPKPATPKPAEPKSTAPTQAAPKPPPPKPAASTP